MCSLYDRNETLADDSGYDNCSYYSYHHHRCISIVFGVFIALEFIFICSLVHLRSTGRCEWMALVTAWVSATIFGVIILYMVCHYNFTKWSQLSLKFIWLYKRMSSVCLRSMGRCEWMWMAFTTSWVLWYASTEAPWTPRRIINIAIRKITTVMIWGARWLRECEELSWQEWSREQGRIAWARAGAVATLA